jgi:hypothetical protein
MRTNSLAGAERFLNIAGVAPQRIRISGTTSPVVASGPRGRVLLCFAFLNLLAGHEGPKQRGKVWSRADSEVKILSGSLAGKITDKTRPVLF